MKVKTESEVTQLCLTLSDPMDYSLPGSSVHGIFQARVLDWVAIAFSNDQRRHHIKRQRHYFAYQDPSSQSYVFPVVMYGCEGWTIKKAEHQRIDAFELSCWKESYESFGLQRDQTSQSKRKLVINTHWKH